MKKSKLLNCFSKGYRRLNEWGEKNTTKVALATLAATAALTVAWGVKGCKTGEFTPLLERDSAVTATATDAEASNTTAEENTTDPELIR